MDSVASDWNRQTILVVEDSEGVRELVCATLLQRGYRVLEAADGVEALQILESSQASIQLVITDMIMPNMNGAELAAQLSLNWPQVRILFMSGYSDDPLVRSVETASTALFLPKPFTTDTLLDVVARSLNGHAGGLPHPL